MVIVKTLNENRVLDARREFLPKLNSLAVSRVTLFDLYGIGSISNADSLFFGGSWQLTGNGKLYKFFDTKTKSYVTLYHGDIMNVWIDEVNNTLNIEYKNRHTFFFRFKGKEALALFLAG